MARQYQYSNSRSAANPLMEAYHAAYCPMAAQRRPAQASQQSDAEAQQPTHDALSHIYNQDYPVNDRESAFYFIQVMKKE